MRMHTMCPLFTGLHCFLDLPAGSFTPFLNEIPIDAFLRQQFCMCSLLDDLSLINHKNLISVLYGFQTMRNHDDGLLIR